MTDDEADAYHLYASLVGGTDGGERLVLRIIPGNPPTKVRARHGRGRTYASEGQVLAEARTREFFHGAFADGPYPGNVALGCIFYRSTRHRVDADNLLKHVCDSINEVAFADDSQVTAIAGRIELDRANPRTVIILGPHQSTMTRGVTPGKELT